MNLPPQTTFCAVEKWILTVLRRTTDANKEPQFLRGLSKKEILHILR